ncbi:MAG: hypothetical protein WA210_08345 [Burkholderiaceae bacterium]
MLESFKRMFTSPGQGADLAEISAWAAKRGYSYAPMEEGFAIDGSFDGKPWQLEWAPPQRPFMQGHELRMQINAGIAHEVNMMLLSLPLMQSLEKQAFERFTQNLQTQIDDSSPEEMRWLVMFARVDLAALPGVAANYGAVASSPAQGLLWIEGRLATLLQRAVGTLMVGDPPFVMTVSRGRLSMRLQLPDVSSPFLGSAISLFETAVAQALRAPHLHTDPEEE